MNNKKPLRIAFVTNNYTPYSGGVVSSITSFAQELKRSGHEVTIITLDFGVHCNDDPMVQRIPCPVTFMYKKNYMAVPWRARHHLQQLLEVFNPDIIHSQHPFLLGAVTHRVAKTLQCPMVFTYHTVYEDYAHYVPLPQAITRWAIIQLVTSYCKSVQLVVTPSVVIQNTLKSRGIPTPTAVIRSGLQSVFVPKEQPAKRKQQKPFTLLVVSRFVPEKNIGFILDLFKQLKEQCPDVFQLTLIGYGQEFELLKKYAYDTLTLSAQEVVFIHKPDKKVIAQAYRQADLFLFASHTDVQPLALVEALAGATPIIALAGVGRAVIKHGYNGFIAHSMQEMIAYIMRIAESPELHQQLQDNAWKTAQDYVPAQTTAQLVESYYNVIDTYQR